MANYACFLSCEHGGNYIPPAFLQYFLGQEKVLQSHRGWDAGTLEVSEYLFQTLGIPLVYCTTSRLLIEMNRSVGHPQLFSEFTQSISEQEKADLLAEFYHPYRNKVKSIIGSNVLKHQKSLHFSIHSFTPVFDGYTRDVDLGLLFDPARPLELQTSTLLKSDMQMQLPHMQIRFNEPYLGIDDGLTTYLRTQYDDDVYAGIEIEINQKWVGTEQFSFIKQAVKFAIENLEIRKPVTK
ncbi:N-formylglutamate amidohydrolase [Catalinimonas sp. 4WD22]|uniref:N-formylglutamate amidohydrolase n=1 Tax=Catalinimonas locisalis TaxID=3133978 RepID=UPI0031014905